MHKRITFREMEKSDVMEKYIDEQLEKIIKFIENERDPIYVDFVLESGRPHAHHQAELRVKTPNYDLISNYEDAEMYDVIDRVIDVMYRQLTEKKKELQDKRRTTESF